VVIRRHPRAGDDQHAERDQRRPPEAPRHRPQPFAIASAQPRHDRDGQHQLAADERRHREDVQVAQDHGPRVRDPGTINPRRVNASPGNATLRLVDLAPAVPRTNHRSVVYVSRRVGNVQSHQAWFTLLDQLWVR
jgi:hypothetical protein